MVLNNNKITNY